MNMNENRQDDDASPDEHAASTAEEQNRLPTLRSAKRLILLFFRWLWDVFIAAWLDWVKEAQHPKWIDNTLFVVGGVLLPIVCFAITWHGPIERPEWQSGTLDSYVPFLQTSLTAWVFFPALGIAMASLLLSLWKAELADRSLLIRLGVYSGIPLALQFSFFQSVVICSINSSQDVSILEALTAFAFLFSIAFLGPFCIWIIIRGMDWSGDTVLQKYPNWHLPIDVVSLLVVVGLIFCGLFSIPFWLLSAPYWCIMLYGIQSIRLWRRQQQGAQFGLTPLLVVFVWLGGFFAAWKHAIALMLVEYAKLPTEPTPDCFIASAAAKGHRPLVGAKAIACQDGTTWLVNRQLAVLKGAELAVLATCPRLHRMIRRLYNLLGPPLAARMQSRWMADLAYLALKPAEWIAQLMLLLLLGRQQTLIQRLYQDAKPTKRSVAAED